MFQMPTSSPMMTTMFGFFPPVAGSSAWASRVLAAAAEGADLVAAGSAAVAAFWLAVVFWPLSPEAAGRVEQAIMPPIIAKATLATNMLLSLGIRSSFRWENRNLRYSLALLFRCAASSFLMSSGDNCGRSIFSVSLLSLPVKVNGT